MGRRQTPKPSLWVRNFELFDQTGSLIFAAKDEKLSRVLDDLDERLKQKGLVVRPSRP